MENSSLNKNEFILFKFREINPNYYPLLAFLLTGVVYTLTFSALGMIGKSIYIIETSDLYTQFVPTIMQMCEVIRGKHSLWYSWNMALGCGSIGNYANSAFSPFYIFYLIFGDKHIHAASTFVIILRASMSAMTFQIFVSRIIKKIYFETILFSMLYALNGFVICYYHVFIFMDAVLIFPLIMLGVVYILRNRSIALLSFSYTYLFATQFYMGYIIGLCSFFVFLTYYLLYKKENQYNFLVLLKYALSVIISLGITAVIWLPAVLNIIEMDMSETLYDNPLRPDIMMILNNAFVGQYQSMDGFVPFYYCGLITVFLVPLFLKNQKIDIRKRLFYGIVLFVFFIIMSVPKLNLVMHGFDEPNMMGYRYAFVISFVLIVILIQQFPYIRSSKLDFKYFLLVSLFSTTIFVYSKVKLIQWGKEYDSNSWIVYIINIVYIFAIYLVLKAYILKKNDILTLRFIITALIISEVVINIIIVQSKIDKPGEIVNEFAVSARNNTVRKLKDLSDDDEYIRTIYEDSYIINQGLKSDISSLAFFSSILNHNLINCLSHWGYVYMSNYISGSGWTPITASLLGIDFVIDGAKIVSEDPSEQVVIETNDRYYQNFAMNSKVLPIAFAVSEKIMDYKPEKSVLNNQNRVLSLMCDEDVVCFTPTEMQIKGENIRIEENDGKVRIYNLNYPYDQCNVEYSSIENKRKPMYANLYNEINVRVDNKYYKPPIIYARYDNDLYNTNVVSLYPNQLFEVPVDIDGKGIFRMSIPSTYEYAEYEKGYFGYYEKNEFERVYEKLNRNGMQINEFKDGFVRGEIDCDKNCVLFTSIPYEKGWEVYVDGDRKETMSIIEDAFLGVMLTKGKHEIVFEFIAPGRYLGQTISIISLCIIFVWIINIVFLRKRSEK